MPGIWKIERESGSYLLIIAKELTYHAEKTVLDIITEGSGDDHGNEAKRVYCSWNESSTTAARDGFPYRPDSITIVIVVPKSSEDTMRPSARRFVK